MQLATDLIFSGFLSVNNDLIIYVFATSVGCEIIYVDTTELKNILHISGRVACTINFNIRETWMLRLETWWTFSFLEGSKYLT